MWAQYKENHVKNHSRNGLPPEEVSIPSRGGWMRQTGSVWLVAG